MASWGLVVSSLLAHSQNRQQTVANCRWFILTFLAFSQIIAVALPIIVKYISGLLDNFSIASPFTVFFGLVLSRCNIVIIVNLYHHMGFCTIIAVRDNLLFHQR